MKKVGLALGSGGARGYAHIGVIKVLENNSIPIDYLSGSSMGSIIAAHYALYKDIEKLEELALSFSRKDYLKIVDLNVPTKSLVKGKKAYAYLKTLYGNKTFKDTKIPLKLVATDILEETPYVFTEGKIVDAVMASCTFPGVFPVFKHKGRYLVDGGLSDAVPVSLVKKADVIIGVDLYSYGTFTPKDMGMHAVLEKSFRILLSKLSNYQELEYSDNVVIIKPNTGDSRETFAFHHAERNIPAGEKEARKAMPRIRMMLDE